MACTKSFAPIALRRDRVVEFVGLRESLALSPDSLIQKPKTAWSTADFSEAPRENSSDQTSLEKLSDCFEGAPLQEWSAPNLSVQKARFAFGLSHLGFVSSNGDEALAADSRCAPVLSQG
jgi:hypothetical protein